MFFIFPFVFLYLIPICYGQYAQSCVSTIAGKLPSAATASSNSETYIGQAVLDWLSCPYHEPTTDGYKIILPGLAGPDFKFRSLIQLGPTNYLNIVAGGVLKTIDDRVADKRALPGQVMSISAAASGVIYFSSFSSVFSVTPSTGIIKHIAFVERLTGYSGDGGLATLAVANDWIIITVSKDNKDLYVCDVWNSLIRKVDIGTGIITTFAGTYCDPNKLACPSHIDKTFTQDGIPATSAVLNLPWDVEVDSNFVYILDSWFHRVRKVSLRTGIISTIAGLGLRGGDYGKSSGDGGPATSAWLNVPRSMGITPNGDVYVSDTGSSTIRKISAATGIITTIAGKKNVNSACNDAGGDGGPAWNSSLAGAWGIHVAADGSILIGDCGRLRMINPLTGIINTVPVIEKASPVTVPDPNMIFSPTNTTLPFFDGRGGIQGIVAANNDRTAFYFTAMHAVYYFDPLKHISIIAGNSDISGFLGDGGPALKALLNTPTGISMTSIGDLYLADRGNNRIRKISKATGIITTIAGSGISGSLYTTGGSALLTQFLQLEQILVDEPRNRLLVGDYHNNALYSITLDTNLLFVIAGIPGASQVWDTGDCDLKGDGGPATSANLNSPLGLYVTRNGTIFFADNANHVIRRIDPLTNIITSVVGLPCVFRVDKLVNNIPILDGELANQTYLARPNSILINEENDDIIFTRGWVDGLIYVVRKGVVRHFAGKRDFGFADGSYAKDALFRTPNQIIWGPQGSIIILDQGNAAIRMLPFNMTTSCLSGYFCNCGWNPVSCWNASIFCPVNTAVPYSTSRGYITPDVEGLEKGSIVHIRQILCPKGAYCNNGILTPCSAGTFGNSVGQYSVLSCIPCAPGTFISETGGSSEWGTSACTPCPLGTTSNKSGRSFCNACPASTFVDSRGFTASCKPCLNGTYALPGSSECFTLSLEDVSSIVGNTHSFQRVLPVSSGNLPDRLATLMLYQVISPIMALSFVPLIFAFILLVALPRGYAPCCSTFSRLTARYKEWLHSIDSFSMLDADPGKSPINEPSTSGGVVTIIAGSVTIALMLSTFISWITSNNLLSQSVNPLDLRALQSFSALPAKVQSIEEAADLPRPLNLTSGFSIEIATQGTKCSTLSNVGFSSEVAFGTGFVYLPPFQTNGTLVHTFSCLDCLPNAQSTLSVTFPPSCQFYLVTMTAIGAGGGISATTVTIENDQAPISRLTSIGMKFPMNIEIIQDTVNGITEDGGEVFIGGESATGLFTLPATDISVTYGPGDDRKGEVLFIIGIPLQPNYKLFTITQMQTFLTMVSSVFAWASAFGLFIYLKQLHRAIKDYVKRPDKDESLSVSHEHGGVLLRRGSLKREKKSVRNVFTIHRVDSVAKRTVTVTTDPIRDTYVSDIQPKVGSRWSRSA
jgi:hypothetical protein